jgi:hypothetical protein
MIKNPKLLAVCLIVANVFFFGAYAYVTAGETLAAQQRFAVVLLFLAFNFISYMIHLIIQD